MSEVLAVLCSDLHLSHRCPIARSAEPDWYAAMKRPLDELRQLAEGYDVPIVCAGDLLDRPSEPAELVNWAIGNLPKMYSIYGQHDIFYHSSDSLPRTAYWTLVECGVIINLEQVNSMHYGSQGKSIFVFGYPWRTEIWPANREIGVVNLAVIHKYLWTKGSGFPGAPTENHISASVSQLQGYDAAVFGDNHNSFIAYADKCSVVNPGTLMKRKLSERDYKPMVGLLKDDASIEPHYLDCSQDKWMEDVDDLTEKETIDTSHLIESLETLQEALDFEGAVVNYIRQNTPSKKVEHVLMKAIGR